MVEILQEKKDIPPEEIKFESAEIKEPENWEISSWSALNLVPQNQSSAIAASPAAAAEDEEEEGEIQDNPQGINLQDDKLLDDLMNTLSDFYQLIPKRHLKKWAVCM